MAKPRGQQSPTTTQENPTPVQESYRAAGEETILSLIQDKSGRSRTSAKQLMGSGRVSLNGRILTKATEAVRAGDLVTVHAGIKPKDFSHPLIEKVWEDEDLLLVYKKAGISTVNTGHKDRTATAIWILSRAMKADKGPGAMLFMLNRLDKNSEGFVLFAKNIPAKEAMVKQWGNLIKEQLFVLCLEGELKDNEGTLTFVSGKDKEEEKNIKKASADYRILKRSKKGGLFIAEFNMHAPRIYNIRTFVKENNLSIFGDVRSKSGYTVKDKIALIQTGFTFLHPKTRELLSFSRPFPAHFFDYLRADKGQNVTLTLQKRGPEPKDEEVPYYEKMKYGTPKGRGSEPRSGEVPKPRERKQADRRKGDTKPSAGKHRSNK